jgi:aarF domain-containing kinase
MKFQVRALAYVLLVGAAEGFVSPLAIAKRPSSTAKYSSTSREASDMLREMREELSRNEEANLVMQALRGQNLNDDDSAVAGLEMRLVDIDSDSGAVGDRLQYEYDPLFLKEYFRKRPGAVVTRFLQLTTVLGGFVIQLAIDSIFKRLEGNPDLEIQRAGELRDKITSLGPFYIKVSTVERNTDSPGA